MAQAGTKLDRIPPQNIEAEQATLGSMLIDRDAISKAVEIVQSPYFYKDAHRIIYEVIVGLFEKGEPVDLVTVTEVLRSRDLLEQIGGVGYLTSLASVVPTAANVEYYARIVEEKHLLRSLIAAGTEIAAMGYDTAQDVDVALDNAERLIFSIAQGRTVQTYDSIKNVLVSTLERIETLYNNKGGITGLSTGFYDLDRMLSGFQRSDLIIIAGRPSMGKTSLMLNIAQHMAVNEHMPVAIFSLEVSKEQLVMKMLCSEARIDSQRLRTGNLTEDDWERLTYGVGRLSEAPIFIDDTPALSVLELRAKARRLKAEHGLDVIFIDYLQLMQSKGRIESRQQEIAEITRSLKSLARELSVPVVALAQLSRAVESTSDNIPRLNHLKESGEIEQTADVVAFIYREDYYNPQTENQGVADIIIAKQRNGPTGTVQLGWQKQYTRFVSLERLRSTE
jgi:replicative DNA helicase